MSKDGYGDSEENGGKSSVSFSNVAVECPDDIAGHLWKKSPNPLRFRQYQQRHVSVSRGILTWTASIGAVVRGRIDFGRNPCEVVELPGTGTAFEIRPLEGGWVDGDFTGVESGRTLVFDAIDSEKDRSDWIEALQAQIAYARVHGPSLDTNGGSRFNAVSFVGDAGAAESLLAAFNHEDDEGTFPLKEEWSLRVPKPPVPDRSTWRGVYTGAPTELVEELAGNARFKQMATPLDCRPGEPDASEIPNAFEDAGLRHVMEFINYFFVLMGRPRCWYGGIGRASEEVRCGQDTKTSLHPGHFECKNCFACPYAGTGGVSDLMRNCWHTQAMLNHGGLQWMAPTTGSGLCAAPFGLQAVPMPARAERAELLKDREFTKGLADIKKTASRLFTNGHGPYIVVYKRPRGAGEAQRASGNDSRVLVYPPPGMIVKGSFQGEVMQNQMAGRKGLPGEDEMGQQPEVSSGMGSTTGGPCVKVHFVESIDKENCLGCEHVELVDLETGIPVPCWVSDANAVKGDKYYQQNLNEWMSESGAQLWVIPKPILACSREYQVTATIRMRGGDPLDLAWTFVTFGPRVYDVPSPFPKDTTQSLDWALETISDMKMKPLLRSDGRPVPSVICVKAGEYHIKARFIDPGPWLHLEGAGAEDTTIVVESPEVPPTFDFPQELGLGDKGKNTGFEHGWHNPDVPLFNMVHKCFWTSEHDGGGADPGGWTNPSRLVTMSGVTLRHNVPLVLGNFGSLELVDCHVIGAADDNGKPVLSHQAGGPKLRFSEVTRQPSNLFAEADLDGDGYIDRSELHQFLEQGLDMAEEEADQLFEHCDVDQDGRLSHREFDLVYHALCLQKNEQEPAWK